MSFKSPISGEYLKTIITNTTPSTNNALDCVSTSVTTSATLIDLPEKGGFYRIKHISTGVTLIQGYLLDMIGKPLIPLTHKVTFKGLFLLLSPVHNGNLK